MKILDLNLFMNLFNLIFMMIIIIPSNMYYFNPVTLNILLILYIIILMFKLNLIIGNCWYSYTMFLVMIGGLMILFMYFVSLIGNNMFYFTKKYFYDLFLKMFILIILMIYLNKEKIYLFLNMNFIELNTLKSLFLHKNSDFFKNLMMDYSMNMNLYTIIYLFFTMICTILICYKINIPLRQISKFNYE